MKAFLCFLAVVMCAGLASALKCYECHDLVASSSDPGLSDLIDEVKSGNTEGCPADKEAGGVTCDASRHQCIATNVTLDVQTEQDGVVETGHVTKYLYRGCFPISQKDWPPDCYAASEFVDEFKESIRQGLGEDFTGTITLSPVA